MKESVRQIQSLEVKPIQRLILSQQMQQSLQFLQLPILELSSLVAEEAEQNPLLEVENLDESFLGISAQDFRGSLGNIREEDDLHSILEQTLSKSPSLYESLSLQIRETLSEKEKQEIAHILIGHLDEQGFLRTPLDEISYLFAIPSGLLEEILSVIHTFHPPGVGARTLQECFLLQLISLKKKETLAYTIIEKAFDAFTEGDLQAITKILKCSLCQVKRALQTIQTLSFSPLLKEQEPSPTLTPDITIAAQEGTLTIEINEQPLPHLRFNTDYIKLMRDPTFERDTQDYIKEKMAAGRILLKNIFERKKTLERLAEALLSKQHSFFSLETDALVPLKMKELAEELGLHESTIARAVSQKVLACPRGIFPLRSFFSGTFVTESGKEISAQWVKERIVQILRGESKTLSDAEISRKLKEEGITCARRTVTKYRKELGLVNSSIRKRKYGKSASTETRQAGSAKSL